MGRHIEGDFFFSYNSSRDKGNPRNNSVQETRDNEGSNVSSNTEDSDISSITLAPGQILHGTSFKTPQDLRSLVALRRHWLLESFDGHSGTHSTLPELSLTAKDVTRLRMAWRALESINLIERWKMSSAFTQRCKDRPGLHEISSLPIAIGFTTVALVYGGLHALAWFAHFDTSTEQLLWRISACVVMGGFPVFLALLKASDRLSNRYYINAVFRYTALFVLLAYALSRAYLVVECFINLSHLPAGVYDIPQWATYFPHIS